MSRHLSLLAVVVFAAASAFATCAAPSTPGLNMCFPTQGSTLTYPVTFEFGANTGSAAITGMALYDNGKKVTSFSFLPARLIEGGVGNGSHRVTAKIWDSAGRIHSVTRTFNVKGFGVGSCSADSIGVNLCWPAEGSFQPNTSVPVSFGAKGEAKITAWKMYLDGKFVRASTPDVVDGALTSLGMAAGAHRVTVVAWDAAGHVYKSSRTFRAYYSYGCNPVTEECSPGIVAEAPAGFGETMAVDVPQHFTFRANVVNNPDPTTAMKVMLDGKVIGSSQGPGITVEVDAAAGSHIVSVQAWDTAGNMYATYGNVYVH